MRIFSQDFTDAAVCSGKTGPQMLKNHLRPGLQDGQFLPGCYTNFYMFKDKNLPFVLWGRKKMLLGTEGASSPESDPAWIDRQRVRVCRQEKKRFGSEKCIMHESLIRNAAVGSCTANALT